MRNHPNLNNGAVFPNVRIESLEMPSTFKMRIIRVRQMVTREHRSARLPASSLDLKLNGCFASMVFRDHGGLSEACRMSPAKVYRLFASKSAINNSICEHLIAEDETALVVIAGLPAKAYKRRNCQRRPSSSI
jgi:hypothetical protein